MSLRRLIGRNFENAFLSGRNDIWISENSTYGSNFINTLSASLKSEFPDVTGFSPRNLSRMKKFYEEYRDQPNLPPAVAKSDLNLAEKFRFVRDMIMIPFIDKCSISDSLS